jgi:hypothetical protein
MAAGALKMTSDDKMEQNLLKAAITDINLMATKSRYQF